MATNTYVALDKVTVGTATSSITFSSIPQTYTDLVMVINTKQTATPNRWTTIRLNSDTGTNYSYTSLEGSGSAASSYRESNQTRGAINFKTSTTNWGQNTVHFQNYSNSTTYKTWISRGDSSDNGPCAIVGLWRSTSAVTSILITLEGSGQNFDVGSTFSLYGIAASSVGAKATGGTISSDSQYYYHTFTSTGTFTPLQSLSADMLVVAGGGGGGSQRGCRGNGGGGAGGYQLLTSQSFSATGYTVTVGAGGAAGTTTGSSGSNSVLNSITSTGGGGGGAGSNNGLNGGSGGGGVNYGTGGTGTSGQGYAGGSGAEGGGGGGGAGSIGIAGNVTAAGSGGNGGAGSNSAASWATATGMGVNGYFAGGGGGGSGNGTGTPGLIQGIGGAGGGGTAYYASSGQGGSGVANTGGGGAGGTEYSGCTSGNGGAGGSGIVIVRYAK
jgi:hypothetical protein